MDEAKRRQLAVQTQALEAMAVDTPGGRIHMQWDHDASATPNAQLVFSQSSWPPRASTTPGSTAAPLSYTSPNAHSKRDVLGTWLLAILAGHKRYAHITGLRGDAVSPQILGMQSKRSANPPCASGWHKGIKSLVRFVAICLRYVQCPVRHPSW